MQIPKEVGQLTSLCTLDVSHNKDITTIPDQLGTLSKLWEVGKINLRKLLYGVAGEICRRRTILILDKNSILRAKVIKKSRSVVILVVLLPLATASLLFRCIIIRFLADSCMYLMQFISSNVILPFILNLSSVLFYFYSFWRDECLLIFLFYFQFPLDGLKLDLDPAIRKSRTKDIIGFLNQKLKKVTSFVFETKHCYVLHEVSAIQIRNIDFKASKIVNKFFSSFMDVH